MCLSLTLNLLTPNDPFQRVIKNALVDETAGLNKLLTHNTRAQTTRLNFFLEALNLYQALQFLAQTNPSQRISIILLEQRA